MTKKADLGITRIAVKGFKSLLDQCEIDIRPLTILAGANSSGKSSIMQPLLMLKQTLDSGYDPGPLLIDGPNVQFTKVAQFLSTFPTEEGVDGFQVSIETSVFDVLQSVTTIFRNGHDGIEISEMTAERKKIDSSSTNHFTLSPNMSIKEIELLNDQPTIPMYSTKDLPEEIRELEDVNSQLKKNLFNFIPEDSDITRSRCFLELITKKGFEIMEITDRIRSEIRGIIHLPGLRGNPERTYKMSGTGPRFPGTFENYVASIIHKWQQKNDRQINVVAAALSLLKLAGQVNAEKFGDARIELQVSRLTEKGVDETDLVSIADVGFGVSQVLPIIVALRVARKGQLVFLEQPELHLHPSAQFVLARILSSAAKRGVRVVVETHSSLLLLGIQTLVAEGKISPDLIKLHWFSRNEKGITEVNSVDLDESGRYGAWPIDFDDVDLYAQSRYLDAIDKKRFEQEEKE